MSATQRKKRLLSGVKSTGRPHVGNYLGAMKQWVDLQDQYEESFIFVANYHALTTLHNGPELKQLTFNVVLDYLAIGLDPAKVCLYTQTYVPQVTELTWIFNCITTMPYLERAHAYKDALAKGRSEIGVGVFDYPILMAADILLMDPDTVPVGKDQQQHVEYARDIALKFNRIFGETFVLPEALVKEEIATIPGTDGQKMSKSYGNTIPLFATDEEVEKAVMSIPTDSKGINEPKNPEEDIVYRLHAFFSAHEIDSLREGYEKGGLGYGESKKKLIKNIISFITPLREKREEFAKRPDDVKAILAAGGAKAHERAEIKMEAVRHRTGLAL